MEHSPIKYPGDGDVEDGEISDGTDGGYTPLARPAINDVALSVAAATHQHHHHMQTAPIDALSAISKMEEASDKDESLGEASTDSDSDNAIINQPRDGRTKRSKIRIKPLPLAIAQPSSAQASASAAHHRKNNIWATGLQEESLMENLKGCGVDREASSAYDRSVESYDYSLRFRLNGENALKRRKSSNSDSSNERPQTKYVRQFQHAKNKRGRANGGGGGADGGAVAAGDGGAYHHKKKNVRQRLGRRSDDSSSNDAGGQLDGPRTILDLDAITAHSTNETVAKDLASKLHEEKDELMLRIIEILGNDLPLLVFAETQRIEANGGMLIMNGQRRRTPGGVFLFLLKNSGDLSADHRKAIFTEESRKQNREQKLAQAQKRDRKVEQLKQTLRIENELTALATRNNDATQATATASGERDETTLNNLSNPPPSPVTDGNRENSSDFDTHTIKHVVNMASPEKWTCTADAIEAGASVDGKIMPGGSSTAPYEDDFLDMHCDDMDMF